MSDYPCGGCEGLGSHRRWCPATVGFVASHYGRMSEQAERMGDSIGANDPGCANLLYAASGRLREYALARVTPTHTTEAHDAPEAS